MTQKCSEMSLSEVLDEIRKTDREYEILVKQHSYCPSFYERTGGTNDILVQTICPCNKEFYDNANYYTDLLDRKSVLKGGIRLIDLPDSSESRRYE